MYTVQVGIYITKYVLKGIFKKDIKNIKIPMYKKMLYYIVKATILVALFCKLFCNINIINYCRYRYMQVQLMLQSIAN